MVDVDTCACLYGVDEAAAAASASSWNICGEEGQHRRQRVEGGEGAGVEGGEGVEGEVARRRQGVEATRRGGA